MLFGTFCLIILSHLSLACGRIPELQLPGFSYLAILLPPVVFSLLYTLSLDRFVPSLLALWSYEWNPICCSAAVNICCSLILTRVFLVALSHTHTHSHSSQLGVPVPHVHPVRRERCPAGVTGKLPGIPTEQSWHTASWHRNLLLSGGHGATEEGWQYNVLSWYITPTVHLHPHSTVSHEMCVRVCAVCNSVKTKPWEDCLLENHYTEKWFSISCWVVLRLSFREKVVPGWLLVQDRKMRSLTSMCVTKQLFWALFTWSVRIPHEGQPEVRLNSSLWLSKPSF